MARLNLYRVERAKSDDLLAKADEVGLSELAREVIHGYEVIWLLSEDGRRSAVPWLGLYERALAGRKKPQNVFHFGMIVFRNDDACYVLSMGKSHFYLRDYCDSDFGMDLGERVSDGTARQKCTRSFASTATSVIVSYRKGTDLENRPGEALQHVKGGTVDDDIWGGTASFGQSYQTHLDVDIGQIPALLKEIEEELTHEPRQPLPRLALVHAADEKASLDAALAEAIASSDAASVEVQQQEVVGVSFVFSDEASYEFYFGRRTVPVDGEPAIADLKRFADREHFTLPADLERIKVRVIPHEGSAYSRKAKEVLEFVHADRYLLYQGKWHRFDQHYLAALRDGIDRGIQFDPDDPVPFDAGQYARWKEASGNDDGREHREEFIIDQWHRDGHVLLHEQWLYPDGLRQELADLYRDGALLFLKAGTTQTLSSVFAQANRTLKTLRNPSVSAVVDKFKLARGIGDIDQMCLVLLMDRKSPLRKLSEVGSLAFLIALAEWQHLCSDGGYRARVRVGYY